MRRGRIRRAQRPVRRAEAHAHAAARGAHLKLVAHVLGPSGGGIRRHVRYLALHPPSGFETAGVWGPPDLKQYFGEAAFHSEAEPVSGADIVHTHGLTAAARAVRERCKPLVVTVHTDIATQGRTAKWPPLRFVARRVAAHADAVIAVSDRVARSFRRARVIAPASERLSPPTRSRDEVRASLATPAGSVVVVTAARLHRDKALDVFVRSVSGSGAHGWICGDGPDRERIAALANGTRVRLLGYRDDVSDLLAAADMFALPSAGEAYGIAVVEALQAGLPVVVTDAGAMRDIVGDAGIIVGAGDDVAFGEAVRDVVTNADRRYGLAARATNASFPEPAELVERIGEVYRSVCP